MQLFRRGTTIALPSRQRLLALAILVGLVALAWLGIIRPLTNALSDSGGDTGRSLKLLAAYRQAAALRPALESQFQALRKSEATSPGLVSGASPALAAATLQSEVKRIIEANKGEIRSTQNLSPATSDNLDRIEIRYDIVIAMSRLAPLTYQLETHLPYLFIDHVDMRAPDNWRPDNPGEADPKLSIRWDIRAYRWAGAS